MTYSNEKILTPWLLALIEGIKKNEIDFSSRQTALFLSIYLIDENHTIRGLAKSINISKAAVSRAVNSLESLGYVRRIDDKKDSRSIIIQKTVKGKIVLDKFVSRFEKYIEE
tara:strand:- start:283 stop:618 length:336 start_codon:yes stop_codon:yes gene_type:complete